MYFKQLERGWVGGGGGERGELSWKYYKQDSWVGRVTQIIASGLRDWVIAGVT